MNRSAWLIVAVVAGLVVWLFGTVLMVAFASVLVAVMLDWLVRIVRRFVPLPHVLALILVLAVIVGLVITTFTLVGMRLQDNFTALFNQVPDGVRALSDLLGLRDYPSVKPADILAYLTQSGIMGQLANYTSAFFGATVGLFLIVVSGIYLAAQPRVYVEGVRKLFPKNQSRNFMSALANAGRALRLWMVSQLILMVVVGTAVTVGLMIIGLPTALALGLVAGVLEFIPVAGPVLAAIPALLVGISHGGDTALWVLGLYLLVNQLEGNILVPIVQARTVHLPPVLGLFSLLIFGILFGPLGIMLGTPIAVVGYVLVKQLYVRDKLGREVEIPGERHVQPEDPVDDTAMNDG